MQAIGRHGLVVVAALTLLCTGLAGTARAVGTAQIVVPSPLFSIQAAVNAAANGGIVAVGPGVYHEQIDFKGKSITVRSLNGPATTTLRGGNAGGVVSFHSGETAAAILAGFTITGGIDSGIQIAGPPSSPTIMNNVIAGNAGCGFGDAIRVFDGSPTIVDNIISHNTIGDCSGGFDGAIVDYGSGAPEIGGNVIVDNDSSGVQFSAGASQPGVVANNVILGNWGAGVNISTSTASALIVQNLIVGNESGIAVNGRGGGPFPVFAFNTTGISVEGQVGTAIVQNLVVANTGGGILLSPTGPAPPVIANTVSGNGFSQLRLTVSVAGEAITDNILDGANPVECDPPVTLPPSFSNNDLDPPGVAVNTGACARAVASAGNISASPEFAAGSFAPAAASTLVDAGTSAAPLLPPTDVVGMARIESLAGDVSGPVDIGAYEFQGR